MRKNRAAETRNPGRGIQEGCRKISVTLPMRPGKAQLLWQLACLLSMRPGASRSASGWASGRLRAAPACSTNTLRSSLVLRNNPKRSPSRSLSAALVAQSPMRAVSAPPEGLAGTPVSVAQSLHQRLGCAERLLGAGAHAAQAPRTARERGACFIGVCYLLHVLTHRC